MPDVQSKQQGMGVEKSVWIQVVKCVSLSLSIINKCLTTSHQILATVALQCLSVIGSVKSVWDRSDDNKAAWSKVIYCVANWPFWISQLIKVYFAWKNVIIFFSLDPFLKLCQKAELLICFNCDKSTMHRYCDPFCNNTLKKIQVKQLPLQITLLQNSV